MPSRDSAVKIHTQMCVLGFLHCSSLPRFSVSPSLVKKGVDSKGLLWPSYAPMVSWYRMYFDPWGFRIFLGNGEGTPKNHPAPFVELTIETPGW